ncbi:MAG: transcription elongation factor GreA [Azospirillum brasilense]|nr:MAG: transcription elongation factor GreA [Azospirillum brasilense]
MEKIPMTAVGFERLEKELKQLKTVDRPAVIEAISEARAHGDLKENAEYHAAKEKQSFIEGRIKELEAITSRADVIDVRSLQGDTVKFGATVTVVDEDSEEELTYQIVSEYEADINRRLISLTAPIGRALIGKKQGTSVEVHTPKGVRFYEVLTVEYK